MLKFIIMTLLSFITAAESVFALDLGLIEPAILYRGAGQWIILDARPRPAWEQGHIAAALPFSWENYTKTDDLGVQYRIWSAKDLGAALGRLGMNEKSPVAVYGDAETSWGGEGWICWMLARLGHQGPVRLLDGGIEAWKSAGLPLAGNGALKTRPALTYKVMPTGKFDITALEIANGTGKMTVIDVRSSLEWLAGHIPGAVHIPWQKFYAGPDRRPLGSAALNGLLRDNKVAMDKPVVYYCTGGIRSGYAWLVHKLANPPQQAINFEGGTEEWRIMKNGRNPAD